MNATHIEGSPDGRDGSLRSHHSPIGARALLFPAALVALLGLLAPSLSTAESDPLTDDGGPPSDATKRTLGGLLCSDPRPAPVCRCRGTAGSEVAFGNAQRGSFSEYGRRQMLVEVEGCDASGTVLADLRDGEVVEVVDYFPDVRISPCRRIEATDAPSLLVCHRTIEADTWRIGFVYSLDLRGGALRRRQLATYDNNARGCPETRVETTQPVGWRVWRREQDPRAPLLTIHYQDRDGEVPSNFENACEAMEEGTPVFGPLRRRTEYYTLEDRRFRYVGARSLVGTSGEATWVDERRPRAPICRRKDALHAIRSNRPAFAECYARALRSDATLQGALAVKWRLDRDGHVASTRVLEDELEHAPLRSCVRSVVRSFELPPPRGASSCSFEYTFEFRRSDDAQSEERAPSNDDNPPSE